MQNENNLNIIKYDPTNNLPVYSYRESMPDNYDDEIHLRDYIEVVMRRKWLLISMLFFTFISTLIFSLTAEKYYKASGSLEVNQSSQNVTKFKDVVETNFRYDDEFVSTQISLLQSNTLSKRVIQAINLAEHPVITGDKDKKSEKGVAFKLKTWIKSLIPKNKINESDLNRNSLIDEVRKSNSILGFFKGNLEISPVKDSMIINVSFMSPSRQLSKDAVNHLMDEFIDWKMDQKLAASQKAREYLMKQIDHAKINLEKAEEEQNQFARQAGIVSMDSKLNSVYRQLEEINSALSIAEAELINKQVKYEQALQDGPSSLPEVLKSKLVNDLKSEHARLLSEYEDKRQIFHQDFPDVSALGHRIKSINDRIEKESERIFNSIKHDYKVALNRVEALRRKLDYNKQQALALNERATQYLIMNREVETNKAIYQSLLERAKEIESMAGISPSNIQVVDKASLPIFPEKPDVKRNLLLAIVLGLMAGLGGVFLVEYFTDIIINPDQISDRFNIPILGVIPEEKSDQENFVEMIFTNKPHSVMTEALRTSKVSIQLSGSGRNARCIAITSTEPNEGKTTIASNLAQAFAGTGDKVVLIDADLRKPRLHKIFSDLSGMDNTRGLSSFLAGVVSRGFIFKTSIKNLYLIPSGQIPPNPVELLASNRFALLIRKLSEKFDRIIIDTPPYQGYADILVLSRQVGGMILVSSIGKTSRQGLRSFKKAMQNVQGNVLGCIVNRINLQKKYGYRSYYKYYSAYNSESVENGSEHKKLKRA